MISAAGGRSRFADRLRRAAPAWALTVPALVTQFFFGWFPVCTAFIVALQRYYFARPPAYVGTRNFADVMADPLTVVAFKNTFYYAILSIGLTFLLPIFISILLMEMKRSTIRLMMILWFLPVGSTAGTVIWKYLYNVRLGLLDHILHILGVPPVQWLDNPNIAMVSLVLPGLILFGPGLIYVATLQNVPEELYEAAELEGSGFARKIAVVTLPRLRPIIAMMLIFSVISSMQVFDGPFIMTGGGPGYATTTVVLQIYNMAFRAYNLGKATALAIVLFVVIMGMVGLLRKFYPESVDG